MIGQSGMSPSWLFPSWRVPVSHLREWQVSHLRRPFVHVRHGLGRHALLICSPRVARNLGQALVPRDGRDLVNAAPGLSAYMAKPVRKAARRKGLARVRCQKGQIVGRVRRQNLAKRLGNGDDKRRLGFLLAHA
jgi:hypothetical protein